jgi:hypothetical protein
MLTDELFEDFAALLKKHKLEHAVMLVPIEQGGDDTIQLAIHNLTREQVWMMTDVINKEFSQDRGPLNG